MIRGVLPSITATAEFVVPKSIPMTEPWTFSPFSVAYPLIHDAPRGDLIAGVRRTAGVARDKNCVGDVSEVEKKTLWGK